MKNKNLKIVMLGAGSGFVIPIAKDLQNNKFFHGAEFVLVDTNNDRLTAAEGYVKNITGNTITVSATADRARAFSGADYVITSCEMNRYANWSKDISIPERHGVHQVKGENGGPGGLIHALRNIAMFEPIIADMDRLCPDAWLLNFTNPMSILCTYFKNYSRINTLGFCHQVHGSFGVIAEMLGHPPGEIEVFSAGINHCNWLFDVRYKNTGKSCLDEFLKKVRESKYWHEKKPNIPDQRFTLEVLETFGMYPVGYDDHIIEYFPFFWEQKEWKEKDYESLAETYRELSTKKTGTLEATQLLGKEFVKPPFPVDPNHPYYAENPCAVIHSLETNTPQYFDAINIPNNGAISNLPDDVIVDVPAVAIAGQVRSIHAGALPIGPLEICRRQITLHEMIAKAGAEGNTSLALQALCLDPYVRSITQARAILADYLREYKEYLPKFR